MKGIQYTVMLCILTLGSCGKEAQVSSAPSISLVSVSATELKQFKDSLVIVIAYSDGDGDIGQENPDINDLKVKDRRLSEADYYFVKPLAPPGSNAQISGQIQVRLKNTFLLGAGANEVTQFDIQLKDRAGHWSNSINTPNITITK